MFCCIQRWEIAGSNRGHPFGVLVLALPPLLDGAKAPSLAGTSCSFRHWLVGKIAALKGALPDRAACAAGCAAALLVLDSRSGITGGASGVASIRYDATSRILAARQLTPFSVPRHKVSMPTLGPGCLTRFVTVVAHSGHRHGGHFCVMRHSSGGVKGQVGEVQSLEFRVWSLKSASACSNPRPRLSS